MVFASLFFLYFFLPLNLILYYISKNKVYRNSLLTIFSFFFYAWGEPVWIILLFLSASLDYFNGQLVERFRGTSKAKLGVVLSVVLNLGLLAVFKYSGFIYDNLNALFGLNLKPPAFNLPIGISFYTFQTISYVIDVYRNEVKAEKSYLRFLMFVSLYHQLVAGPIVRYAHIAHEIAARKFNIKDISEGIFRFCIGLFKKVFFSNIAAAFVFKYMDNTPFNELNTGESWFGLIMFSLHIYFDFSGYSDMAIGLGKMFGFHYHENFNYPYIARSASEFWRRWHISLGTFFKDYLYIPLGGNRTHLYRNLLIVWFLTGLWHGASWNFVLWGLYFGFLIMIERLFLQNFLKKLPVFISHVYLIFAAVMGWLLFYFTNLSRMWDYLKIMFGAGLQENNYTGLWQDIQQNIFWIIAAFVLCMPVFPKINELLKKKSQNRQIPVINYNTLQIVLGIILLLISTAFLVGNTYNPFIYFRF